MNMHHTFAGLQVFAEASTTTGNEDALVKPPSSSQSSLC